MIKINPYKMFYYREEKGISIEQLSEFVDIPIDKLEIFERGKNNNNGFPENIAEFVDIEDNILVTIESILKCPNKLASGKNDDFDKKFIDYYTKNYCSKKMTNQIPFSPKAIVFDFDGTLTKKFDNISISRNTWEMLWVKLGYKEKDCSDLAQRYFNQEISHYDWCQLTLKKFKEKNLSKAMVISLAKTISLIDGFHDTIEKIFLSHIPMYIVSGSIRDIIIKVLGDDKKYFQDIKANNFRYDENNIIEEIEGTKYDFEGKAKFITEIAEELHIKSSEILFVGNSINDRHVKQLSGAKTLIVNPHLISPTEENSDYLIKYMSNLQEILMQNEFSIPVQKETPVNLMKAENEDERFLFETIRTMSSINLQKYRVIGNYQRFDDKIRDNLIIKSQMIISTLQKLPDGHQNYLIYGAPGSGKTYYIQQIAKSLGEEISFISIDMSKNTPEQILENLNKIRSEKRNCLCMIDEIDGRSDADCLYDPLYKFLEINDEQSEYTVLFALLGSTGKSLDELRNHISNRQKGKDLLSRIPDGSQYNFSIPTTNKCDGICVFISQIIEAAKAKNIEITHIQKSAILYAAITEGENNRQLTNLAKHSIGRLNRGDTVLTYDHLFSPGEDLSFSFRLAHNEEMNSLSNNLILLEK
jgi:HAD superfamily phosphoserine phosphatase-like hydrolase